MLSPLRLVRNGEYLEQDFNSCISLSSWMISPATLMWAGWGYFYSLNPRQSQILATRQHLHRGTSTTRPKDVRPDTRQGLLHDEETSTDDTQVDLEERPHAAVDEVEGDVFFVLEWVLHRSGPHDGGYCDAVDGKRRSVCQCVIVHKTSAVE